MNMWGLTPEFMEILHKGFIEFLGDMQPGELKNEYLLPVLIDELLHAGKVQVDVLESRDTWFGVTYQEDKEVVMQAFKDLTEAGVLSERPGIARRRLKTMGKYFGTDGFRGEANVKLTVDNAFKVGRYVGWYYGREHKAKIVIGKDTRRSSYMFEYALVAGLTASGADAYLLHVTTTPSVSFAVRTEDFDCGIMISASHNPFYDNGIKLLNGNGQKIEAEIEARIEAYLDGEIEELPLATGADIGRTVDFASGRNRYIGYLIYPKP